MKIVLLFVLWLSLTKIYTVNSIDTQPKNDNRLNLFNDLAPAIFFLDNQDPIIDNTTADNFPTSRNSIKDQTNAVEENASVTMTEVYTDELLKLSLDQDGALKYAVQQEDLKKEYYLNTVNLNQILGEDAQQQLEIENKRDLSQNKKKMRNLQLQQNLQYEFNLQNPNSQIEINSQFKFQFDQFGEGSQHELENVKRIEWNIIRDQEKILPSWLYLDLGSRTFRGQVPEEEVNVSYEITIKFSSGTNQIIDKFLFSIYKNQGICALEVFSSIDTNGYAYEVSTMIIREKIYAIIADGNSGLKIIEVTDPQKPVLIGSKDTNGASRGVSTLQIREKIYALVADGSAGLLIIDVSYPQNPVNVSIIDTNGSAYGVSTMQIREKIYALIADSNSGLQIIDVSYPQYPVNVSIIDTNGSASGVSTMQIREKIYALVADGSAGLQIIDVTDPQKPVNVSIIDTNGSASGVSIMQIREKIYALVADYDAGLQIIDVSYPQNPELVCNIDTDGSASGVSTMQIKEKIYALVALRTAGLIIIEVTDPYKPVVVISQDTDGLAIKVSMIKIGEQIYALVTDGANGLIIYLIKQSVKYRNYFSPISYSQIDTYGLKGQKKPKQIEIIVQQVKTIETGQKIYALVADSLSGLKIIEITDPIYPVLASSIDTNVSSYGVSTMQIREKIYALVAIGQAGLQIIDVSYPQNPVIVSIIDTNGSAYGVSTMQIREKIYALVADGSEGLKIIEVSNPQYPLLVGSIDTNGSAYKVSTMQIREKIYALVSDGSEGLKIIEVSNPQNPVIVGSNKTDGFAYSIITIEIREKIYALMANGNTGLKIIQVNDPQNPVLVSSIDIGGRAMDVSTVELRGKMYALVSDREYGLKIIEVNDPLNPQIIGRIEILGLGFKNAVSSIKIREKYYALLSAGIDGLKIIKFTDDIALYPQINSNIKSQIREFNVKLYPIYMNSLQAFLGETILLSLSLIQPKKKQLTPLPYWVSTNYEEKIINFIPDSKESLEILRYIYYTFSTKINSSELNNTSPDKTSEMVVRELVIIGYLNPNLYLTNLFNIDKDLILDPSFDKTIIKNKLSQYYHEGYFELTIEDFLELNKGPIIKEGELQREFDIKEEKPKVTKKIDFQFEEFAFIDPDGDLLTFTITNVSKIDAQGNKTNGTELPLWLTFDRSSRRFQGIPSINDSGVYTINVTASDKYQEASQNFTILLTNNAPTVQEEIPEEYKSLKLGSKYDYIFSGSLFNDSDVDLLNYQAEIIYTPKGNNTQITQLLLPTGDFWIKFDSNTRRFTGIAGSTDIGENLEGFDQIFTIKITATDIAEESVSKEFNLRVTRLYPKFNKDQNIQDQLEEAIYQKSIVLKVGGKLDFAFNDKTFISQDQLFYRLQIREASINSTSFGNWFDPSQLSDHWLYFDGQNRRIYGIPQKIDIKKYELKVFASDGYKEIESLFDFQITNKAPIVQSSIQNQIKGLYINEPLEFQFDLNSFQDNGDFLTYIALLTNGEALPIWLIFKPEERKFEGTPTKFEKFKVRVTATDLADETVYDDFDIKVIPSSAYIIGQLIYYGSIFFSLLGLLKNKTRIYELICKKKYRYQRVEETYVGEEYTKKIYLIKEDIENAQKLWKKLEEDTILEFNLKKYNWFQLGYMTNQKVDKEKLYNKLYQTFQGAKIMLENMSDKNGIIDGMIANILIQNDPATYNIYKKFKNSSSYFEIDNKRIYSPIDWYRRYILIKQKELEELQTIDINNEQLEKQLQFINIVEQYDKKLLIEKILADSRGIDKLSSWQSSYGENIHINQMQIVTIKVKAQIQDTLGNGLGAGTLRTLYNFAKLNYIDLPVIDKGEIPRWLNVQIEQNTLIFKGLPRKEDKGQFMIQIMGDGNFLLREFFIRVSQKEYTEIEMVQMNTLNTQKNQENKKNIHSQIFPINKVQISDNQQISEYKLIRIKEEQISDDYLEKAINLKQLKEKKKKLKLLQQQL